MYYDALKTFVNVVEERNFTKAAENLRISQPSVSLHIKNLEEEFQTTLLKRTPKMVTVTPTGEMLYERAKQILHLYKQAKQEIYEHHHFVQGKLTIGASFTIGEYVLPKLLSEFHQLYPHVEIEVLIDNTAQIAEHVRLFQADIGLIEGRVNHTELQLSPFLEDELSIIVEENSLFLTQKNLSLSDLQNQTWITREKGSGTREYLKHVLDSNGLKARAFITMSSNQAIKEAVLNGMGMSMLSAYALKKEERIAILPVKEAVFKRKFSYIENPVVEENKNKDLFLILLKKLMKK
ncbi:LysR family transcriptional regulator [Priestia filamentosa]|uniref:LysR family transcriptional regulator n=1 Tax=Priestia filamentosa TaxID=1402861 RepID=UPI001FB3D305|nr:LysR family transcriptional regulator [Priestia filamentosa]MED3729188.1 LysR family transcriptional regulator [Priestia filamentosa]UOE59076.1 LysR family transcriptional regulator [Priestia filamentosa]